MILLFDFLRFILCYFGFSYYMDWCKFTIHIILSVSERNDADKYMRCLLNLDIQFHIVYVLNSTACESDNMLLVSVFFLEMIPINKILKNEIKKLIFLFHEDT